MKRTLMTLLAVLATMWSYGQIVLSLNTEERGAKIGDLHYGIFYEEINHAGDGGLYAELVRNRSFEDSNDQPDSWSAVTGATISLMKTASYQLNEVQTQCLKITATKAGGGARNNGYWGMKFTEGETYKFSAWMRAGTAFKGTLTVHLEDNAGQTLTQQEIPVELTKEWQKVEAEITATASTPDGKMSLTMGKAGTIYVDVVSLFPPTYKDRPNGCRRDLAEKLAALKPSFMRFPGGCYIEGMYREETGQNRFEWKKSIGPIEERPGHWNINWGYRASDGLGFHELLQLSEDLGAKPLFVVNIGIGHDWMVDVNSSELNEYIQEALDAVEYCNGDTTTTWGRVRAQNGHPEPFNLQLIEIGNENEWMDNYEERYKKFYNALHKQYPDLIFIADREVNATFHANDEHYYSSPTWFESQYDKYDRYSRSKKNKVYVGEYAVTQDYGTTGNLKAAIGEAIFMQGMENNSDMVMMNSYAPIFTHESDYRWRPDMIRFNSDISYGTPSYYVQRMMPNYVGRENIKWTEGNNARQDVKNYAGLSTWQTTATFKNFTITQADGTVYTSPLDGTETWTSQGGTWAQNNGVLTQSDASMMGKIYLNTSANLGGDYTLEVDATKKSGAEGFLIVFNYVNDQNYAWVNLGGWGNTQHALEVCQGGSRNAVSTKSGSLTTGKTYHVKVVVSNNVAKIYLDKTLLFTYTMPSIAQRKVYVSSQIDDKTGKLYVKISNPTGNDEPTILKLNGRKATAGKLIQLTSLSNEDQNTKEHPDNVVPTEQDILAKGSMVNLTIPAYSFSIIVLDVVDDDAVEEAESGTYYLYNKEKKAFLSRGADWGTRATLDSYGVPIVLTKDDNGNFTLRYIERNSSYLGIDSNAPYTDKSSSFPITWQLQQAEVGVYRLYNTDKGVWLADQGVDAGCTLTDDKSQATTFCLIDPDMYGILTRHLESKAPLGIEGWRNFDMSEMVENATMADGTEGWEAAFAGTHNTRTGLNEVYEGYGTLTQTIEGLAPGLYCLTIPAFYRGTSNDRCVSVDKQGFTLSNAYIFANGDRQRIATWASDRASDANPNSMEQAATLMGEGKYQNSVYTTVGEDGRLTIGIVLPQNCPSAWLIWGAATLTRYIEPQDFTSHIVNPSFEQDINVGWENNGMQRQGNSEPAAAKTGDQYCEKFIWAGGSLGTASIKQTVTGLTDGDYELSATAHAELQGSTKAVKGVYLFADDQEVNVTTTNVYTIPVSVAGGQLTIGFRCANSDANWITVDNFQLRWMGDFTGAYQPMLERAITRLEELVKTKTILTDELRQQATQLIADARQAKTSEEMKNYIAQLTQKYDELLAYRITVDRNDPYERYLFAYFPDNNNENLYYAVSEDGFKYTPLNEGKRIMASDSVAIKKGIRDPHLLRGQDGKTFYMVATDMRCAEGWDSNRGMVLYKSTDLVHWQHSTVHFPTRFPEWKNVTRVWAPATIWDPDYENADGSRGRYLIYYSLLTNDGKCKYDKVYYSYANDDFTDLLTEPVFFYDRGSATIDADIVYDETDLLYHMIYKNEGRGGICSVTASRLTPEKGQPDGSQWGKPSKALQQTGVAVEGGGLFRLINTNTWVLMYDCYTSGYYQFCTTEDWDKFTLEAQTTTSGAFTPRHGSVVPITPQEYNTLLDAFPSKGLSKIDIPDGIEAPTTQVTMQDEAVYDLSGRRLTNASSAGKGIYIKGKKKVIKN